MANRLQALAEEIATDPLTRGYSGMSDEAVADDLNTGYRTIPVDAVSSSEIYETLATSEFPASLTTADVAAVDRVLGLGDGIKVVGSKARTTLLGIFGPSTATRANLAALASEDVTRGVELGVGFVSAQDVIEARAAKGI